MMNFADKTNIAAKHEVSEDYACDRLRGIFVSLLGIYGVVEKLALARDGIEK